MSLPLPTNRSLKVERGGEAVSGLTGLAAVVVPARAETIALREVPAGQAFEIYFTQVITGLRPTDRLVNEADESEHYRIVGIADYDTLQASHTEVIAEKRLGS